MGRLSLVIADLDRDYLSKLERFLVVNYPQRFDIYSFSSHGKLSEFLNASEKRDILLVNSILFKRELNLKNVEAVIVLKGDGLDSVPEGVDSVGKYQHAETLVTELLRLYSARSRRGVAIHGRSSTRAICVFSPCGGSGKTSIAAGCSILCARKGLKTLYLNLENVPSTEWFFHGEHSQSFSNVIYHLKGSGGSLGLKLEGARTCDPETGVYYFASPENLLEMEELSPDDISRMISELKTGGLYDTVVIDMSTGLDKRNAAALKECDTLVLVLSEAEPAAVKMRALYKGLEILERKNGSGIMEKLVAVINRCGRNAGGSDEIRRILAEGGFIEAGKPVIELGELARKPGTCHHEPIVRETSFLAGLNRLAGSLFPQEEPEARFAAGGSLHG